MKECIDPLGLSLLFLLALAFPVNGFPGLQLWKRMVLARPTKKDSLDALAWDTFHMDERLMGSPVHMSPQQGLMETDKIVKLPGQPKGVDFNQYSGYVTVDPKAGRGLFYYFVESPGTSGGASQKPLVLWLNGGPGCSSFGVGAMMELGPFRVDRDGTTLQRNAYSWNKVANIIFLESPAGVGFSYSNTTSDYKLSGDKRTAEDSYAFLVNWLKRFPQYKARDFYIVGESYAGHYVPQLAYKIILENRKTITNQTVINLRGVAIGNALIDDGTFARGTLDYLWLRTLISDELHDSITKSCFSAPVSTEACATNKLKALSSIGNIYLYDIYAPLCNYTSLTPSSSGSAAWGVDPCSDAYVTTYLNHPTVQKALHAKLTSWKKCSDVIGGYWRDSPSTVLPIIRHLMASGIRVWIYSGDTDARVSVTTSKYAIDKLNMPVETEWYPWYTQGEVGGYAVGYHQGLAFVTVRGAGHLVPRYQPARALAVFSSFLDGRLPPSA